MKYPKMTLLATAVVATLPVTTLAQDTGRHPSLDATFVVNLGAFFPSEGFKLSADPSPDDEGPEIDFDKVFNTDESDTTFAGDLRWRFGEKWSLWGQYWDANVSGARVLQQDITWRDITLEAGTNAEADVDSTVYRVFLGRAFSQGEHHEFGAGIGFHWLDLGASVGGDILVNGNEFEFVRREVDAGAPLPNIGGWYLYSPSSRWAFHARLDWLSANVGDYDGSLWNVGAGVNYQLFSNMGLGLSYNYFQIDVDVDSDDWLGSAEIEQHGPFASLSFNF